MERAEDASLSFRLYVHERLVQDCAELHRWTVRRFRDASNRMHKGGQERQMPVGSRQRKFGRGVRRRNQRSARRTQQRVFRQDVHREGRHRRLETYGKQHLLWNYYNQRGTAPNLRHAFGDRRCHSQRRRHVARHRQNRRRRNGQVRRHSEPRRRKHRFVAYDKWLRAIREWFAP